MPRVSIDTPVSEFQRYLSDMQGLGNGLGSLASSYSSSVSEIKNMISSISFADWQDAFATKLQEIIEQLKTGVETIERDISGGGFKALQDTVKKLAEQLNECITDLTNLKKAEEELAKTPLQLTIGNYTHANPNYTRLENDITKMKNNLSAKIDACNRYFELLETIEFNPATPYSIPDPVTGTTPYVPPSSPVVTPPVVTPPVVTPPVVTPPVVTPPVVTPPVVTPPVVTPPVVTPPVVTPPVVTPPVVTPPVVTPPVVTPPVVTPPVVTPPVVTPPKGLWASIGSFFEGAAATVVDVGANLVEGVLSGAENIADGVLSGVGAVVGWFSDDAQAAINDLVEYDVVNFDSFYNSDFMQNSVLPDTAADIIEGFGSLVAYTGVTALTGIPFPVVAGVGTFGSVTEASLQAGASDDEAVQKGVIYGTIGAAAAWGAQYAIAQVQTLFANGGAEVVDGIIQPIVERPVVLENAPLGLPAPAAPEIAGLLPAPGP